MSRTPLPNLRSLSAQLAAHNDRVRRFVDGLPGRVDKLVAASQAGDWPEVKRLSEYLACSSDIFGCQDVAAAAQAVVDAAGRPNNELLVRQKLIRLIGRCGMVGGPTAPAQMATTSRPPAPAQ